MAGQAVGIGLQPLSASDCAGAGGVGDAQQPLITDVAACIDVCRKDIG